MSAKRLSSRQMTSIAKRCVYAADKKRQRYRAAKDVAALMSKNLKAIQKTMTIEIDLLINLRENASHPASSPMEYLYMLEIVHEKKYGQYL